MMRFGGAVTVTVLSAALGYGADDEIMRAKALGDRYGLEIVLENPAFPVRGLWGAIDGKSADAHEVKAYLPILLAEWELYPVDLVKRSGLQRIVVCKELSFGGQPRNAVPDFKHDTLYLEVVRGIRNKPYLRKVIHHEFFHMIDRKDDGRLYRDERWAALNPRDFKYGSGGKNAQNDPTVGVLSDEFPGFLNRYSTTGVEEDKAEVFAYMIIAPKMMEQRTAKDAVLKAKVERMRELLEKFAPKADKSFWDKVQDTQRD